MSTPKSSSAYPSQMLRAIERAIELGELRIPTKSPGNMLLQYSGLRGALRREGTPDLIDMVSFYKDKENGLFIIRLKENTDYAKELEAALNASPNAESSQPPPDAISAAESALDRILGNSNA